jgi:hypothetical protein
MQPLQKVDADSASPQQSADVPAHPGIVVLENLPCLFSDATLKSIIGHVPCKGRVLSSRIFQQSDKTSAYSMSSYSAHVTFEKKEDADSAIKLWDQLTVDGLLISAWSPFDHPKRVIPQGNPTMPPPFGTTAASATAASSSGFRYPFAAMNIGWLIEYVSMLRNPDKSFTMCRILECLMCNAIQHGDPFLEYAVVTFYTKFPAAAWGKAQTLMSDGVAFELCRQVFEVIGLVCKYPGANPKSRKMLLALVERLVDDISGVNIVTKVLAVNKAIPEVIASVRAQLTQLRNNADSNEALLSLMSWLKFLFSCLSSHHNQIPSFPEASTTYVCSEECPCYTRLRSKFSMFINDVEKAKIVDSLIINAVRDGDDYVGNIAEELMERYSFSYFLRAVKHIQNGSLTLLRMRLFEALRTSKKVHTHHKISAHHTPKYLDIIEVALLRTKEEVLAHASLRSLNALVDDALMCVFDLRDYTDITAAAVQQLYTLQFDVTQILIALCAPGYQLCVHPIDGTAPHMAIMGGGKRSGAIVVKCGNPQCSGQSAELLKCSGCKMTYYCSVECQRADWKAHKALCKETASRKHPSSLGSADGGASLQHPAAADLPAAGQGASSTPSSPTSVAVPFAAAISPTADTANASSMKVLKPKVFTRVA